MTAEKTKRSAARLKAPARKTFEDGGDGKVSTALRHAYEEAVNEDIPAEFLDLLGKLS